MDTTEKELISFRYLDDVEAIDENTIELLDGSGDRAYKSSMGTYITYNSTKPRPLRVLRIIKPPGQRHMAQLLQVIEMQ